VKPGTIMLTFEAKEALGLFPMTSNQQPPRES